MSDSVAPDGGCRLSTANFNVLYPLAPGDGQRSRRSTSYISVRPLPYGGTAVVQSGGTSVRTRTYRVFVESDADLVNLENARGYHGTLTTVIDNASGGVGCTLQDTDATDWWPS